MFKRDKAPFILAILLALIGWSMTHIVDRSLEDPIIEYSIKKKEVIENQMNLTYTLQNISRNKMFRYIEFIFKLSSSSNAKFVEADCHITVCPPLEIKEEPESGIDVYKILVKEFHPNCDFSVDLVISDKSIPALVIQTYASDPHLEYDKQPGTQAIRLVKKNIETYLIKNETKIFVIFLLICILLSFIYMVCLSRSYKKNSPKKYAPLNQKESDLDIKEKMND